MKPIPFFTRRDFLKLSASGALGFFLTETGLDRKLALIESPANYGRVLMSGLFMYEAPSFISKHWKAFGKDQIVPISEVVEGDKGNPFNATWYRIGDEGYSYSGWVQPIETSYNKPLFNLKSEGQVGEVTVPFTGATPEPSTHYNGRRLYYKSTHWVTDIVVNRAQKSIWYKTYDFFNHQHYYVPSYAIRIIPDDEIAPLSAHIPETHNHIYVDLATQSVTAFEGDIPVLIARCSSGAGSTKTPLGKFSTYHKSPSVHMTNQGDALEGIYDLPGVPWCTFFTGTGIAFHGTYWHNDFGRKRSHGCVNLTSDDAKFIYRWTNPVVPPGVEYLRLPGQGTAVQITKSTI